MSGLRLYSAWRSSAAYRVRIALQLKGLEYEYVPVRLSPEGGEQFTPAYRALNPQSRVPALVTPDGVLTQSMAIMEWLEETYPSPALLPRVPHLRARVRAMAQLLIADVHPLHNSAVTHYLQERLHLDAAALQLWLREWIGRGLTALEELIQREPDSGDFCVGATPTLADICLVAQCASSRRFGLDLAEFPRICRIEKACNAMPAFQRAAPERQSDAVS